MIRPVCASLAVLALVLSSGCEARIVTSGCTRTSECAVPRVCIEGVCGSECGTARDCGADRRCVRVGDIGRCLIDSIRQCDGTTACELEGLVCRNERCYNECDACTPDTSCVDGICVLPPADPDAGGHDAAPSADAG